MGFVVLIGAVLVAHLLIVFRSGILGIPVSYVLATIIWVFYPGYETGFGGWIITSMAVVGLVAIGSILPGGAKGVAVAGIGGYLLGKKMAKM